MKIKKLQLEAVFNMLKATDGVLSFADARIRDQIIKPLMEQLKTYFEDREKIYKAFCKNKEDGMPDLLDGDKYQFEPTKTEEINKELETLGNEEVEIYVTDDVGKFKEIMLKSEYKPKIGETDQIEEVVK